MFIPNSYLNSIFEQHWLTVFKGCATFFNVTKIENIILIISNNSLWEFNETLHKKVFKSNEVHFRSSKSEIEPFNETKRMPGSFSLQFIN